MCIQTVKLYCRALSLMLVQSLPLRNPDINVVMLARHHRYSESHKRPLVNGFGEELYSVFAEKGINGRMSLCYLKPKLRKNISLSSTDILYQNDTKRYPL